ncbi:MAG: hypothetical protein AB7K09_25625 [Planctomycetota bacterium]
MLLARRPLLLACLIASLMAALTLVVMPVATAGGDGDFQAGPDDTVRVDNKTCPVTGKDASPRNGVAINGWWISTSNSAAARTLKANPDNYLAILLKDTGIDVNKSPLSLLKRPNRHFAAGPEGSNTKRLDNAKCPVSGRNANADIGAAHNGWWINFSSGGADRKLQTDLDSIVKALIASSGVDIRKSPADYEALPDPAFEVAAGGAVKLGNATCPVTGEAAGSAHVEHNGWSIAVANDDAARAFRSKLDDAAAALLAECGIDVHRKPIEYLVRPKADAPDTSSKFHFKKGPNGTVSIGNERCPLMPKPASERRGIEYNGWFINLCCGDCKRMFPSKVDQVAEQFKKEYGVDIRKTPADQGVQGED